VRGAVPASMPDPGAWLRNGDSYLDHHYGLIGRTIALELAVACLLAWLPHRWPEPFHRVAKWLLPPLTTPHVSTDPVLWSVLRGDLRPGRGELGIMLRLQDGRWVSGTFCSVDFGYYRDASFLALQGQIDVRIPGQTQSSKVSDADLGRLVFSLTDISDLWVLGRSPE
jgi:Family of unknown function (DUF6338)